MKIIFLVLISIIFVSCTTTPTNENGLVVISQSEYERRIEPASKKVETYRGILNTLHLSATLINSQVIDSQILHQARIYQWNAEQVEAERAKMLEVATNQTQMFLSLYTPERKHDDLHKNKTLWKIFLDSQGRRYEGKAVKIKLLTNEIQAMYPEHTRFATPYLVTFPVSTKSIDGQPVKLTLTGTVSSVSLDF
jgi:hypothetical protein